jgi:hypothetical protein
MCGMRRGPGWDQIRLIRTEITAPMGMPPPTFHTACYAARRQPTADRHPEPGFPILPVRSGIDPSQVLNDAFPTPDCRRSSMAAGS